MGSTNRTFVRRWLIPLALLTWGCGDPLAVAVDPATPALLAAVSKPPSGGSGGSGSLVVCSKLPYDSVTQVIGPAGGVIAVGPHFLWIDTLALPSPSWAQPKRVVTIASGRSTGRTSRSPACLSGIASDARTSTSAQ